MHAVEAVGKGEANKLCDRIADAILDAYIQEDKQSKVNIRVLAGHGSLFVVGEITSKADVDMSVIAEQVYRSAGWSDEIQVFVNVAPHAEEVLKARQKGASAAVVVLGYATRVTPELMPEACVLAQALVARLDELRDRDPEFSWMLPDCRVQVTGEKGEYALNLLVQHDERADETFVRTRIMDRVIEPLTQGLKTKVHINTQGRFTQGGWQYHTAASGMCLAADTYGGLIPWTSGPLSGRDPGCIERAGAYFARYAAKSLVASGAAETALVRLQYAAGQDKPLLVEAKSGKGEDLSTQLQEKLDCRAQAIMEQLDLVRPIYHVTSWYGHFGRSIFPWEKV